MALNDFQIIEYEDQYQPVFKALNAEWLDLYELMEPHDMEILDDPRKNIIETGGVIYLAMFEGDVIGSAALIKEHGDVYELAKMSVAKDFRQKGLSRLLMEKCLEKAKELKASKITLFSNHKLKTALALYEKYNFRYIPVENSPFLTADIKMELKL
jgi:putative acetyltransferase